MHMGAGVGHFGPAGNDQGGGPDAVPAAAGSAAAVEPLAATGRVVAAEATRTRGPA